jgi:hypothetical protein
VIRAACLLPTLVATPALAAPHDDYDAPTDTHVELVAGLWHDDVLKPGAGWHLYHFTATATGHVAVQMRAPHGHVTVWSYLRVVDGDRSWAAVGNRKTNLCELIIPVERGKHYAVIATSQQNASLERGRRQISDGPYTIAVLPVAVP